MTDRRRDAPDTYRACCATCGDPYDRGGHVLCEERQERERREEQDAELAEIREDPKEGS